MPANRTAFSHVDTLASSYDGEWDLVVDFASGAWFLLREHKSQAYLDWLKATMDPDKLWPGRGAKLRLVYRS